MLSLRSIVKSHLSLSLNLVDPATRGFLVRDEITYNHLKKVGISFLCGYHAALKDHEISIKDQLELVDRQYKGFAYEGAAMSLALRDIFFVKGDRLDRFNSQEGKEHIYMSYIGAGWALARCPHVNYKKYLDRLDPILKWLVIDGYGFHDGYFYPQKAILQQVIPKKFLGSYASRAYSQGIGRSLWFFTGGEINEIVTHIESFPESRRSDLWSGIGLASAYAGGKNSEVYEDLKRLSKNYWPELAQGVAFACKARHLANLITDHTEYASSIICGVSSIEAALLTDKALDDQEELDENTYESWRVSIQKNLEREGLYHDVL